MLQHHIRTRGFQYWLDSLAAAMATLPMYGPTVTLQGAFQGPQACVQRSAMLTMPSKCRYAERGHAGRDDDMEGEVNSNSTPGVALRELDFVPGLPHGEILSGGHKARPDCGKASLWSREFCCLSCHDQRRETWLASMRGRREQWWLSWFSTRPGLRDCSVSSSTS